MFLRKKTPERSIAKLTGKIGLEPGGRVSWSVPKALGRCALKLGENPKAGKYYELNMVQAASDNSLSILEGTRFIYLPKGEVLGVFRSEINTLDRNDEEIESAMDFQIDSGLVRPTIEDKKELIELLEARTSM
jgi:hypothetical protein